MNSERRHELQQNELAAHLARINRAIEPYSKLIAIAVGAVVLVVIAAALFQSKAAGDRSDATLALIQASATQDPSELAQIAANYPSTAAAAWAKLYEGNALLAEGIQNLFNNRATAEETIQQAQVAFKAALASADDRVVRSRSHFGLARAAESLGEIETAIAQYKETAAANESEAMVTLARTRIESLEDPKTQAFVQWFGEQDFSPPDPSLPPSLPPTSDLSDEPDVLLPGLFGTGPLSSSAADTQSDTTEGETSEGETAKDETETMAAPPSDDGLEFPSDNPPADSTPPQVDSASADE